MGATTPEALVSSLQALVADSSSSLYSTVLLAQVDPTRAVGAVTAVGSPTPAPSDSVAPLDDDDGAGLGWLGFSVVAVLAVAVGVSLFISGWWVRGRIALRGTKIGSGEHNV